MPSTNPNLSAQLVQAVVTALFAELSVATSGRPILSLAISIVQQVVDADLVAKVASDLDPTNPAAPTVPPTTPTT